MVRAAVVILFLLAGCVSNAPVDHSADPEAAAPPLPPPEPVRWGDPATDYCDIQTGRHGGDIFSRPVVKAGYEDRVRVAYHFVGDPNSNGYEHLFFMHGPGVEVLEGDYDKAPPYAQGDNYTFELTVRFTGETEDADGRVYIYPGVTAHGETYGCYSKEYWVET